MVGWWRRVELESSREEKNFRRVESKTVNTARDRRQREVSKLNFLRKFYPECSKSPWRKNFEIDPYAQEKIFSGTP